MINSKIDRIKKEKESKKKKEKPTLEFRSSQAMREEAVVTGLSSLGLEKIDLPALSDSEVKEEKPSSQESYEVIDLMNYQPKAPEKSVKGLARRTGHRRLPSPPIIVIDDSENWRYVEVQPETSVELSEISFEDEPMPSTSKDQTWAQPREKRLLLSSSEDEFEEPNQLIDQVVVNQSESPVRRKPRKKKEPEIERVSGMPDYENMDISQLKVLFNI